MSKSTSKWLWLGVPVGIVAVGSVAVAMGFWIHPTADHAATDRTHSANEDTITRSDAESLIEPMQPAPLYRLPDFALIGRPTGNSVSMPRRFAASRLAARNV